MSFIIRLQPEYQSSSMLCSINSILKRETQNREPGTDSHETRNFLLCQLHPEVRTSESGTMFPLSPVYSYYIL